VSSISATINGSARLVERGSEEEKYYKDVHLENNTFDSTVDAGLFGQPGVGGDGENNGENRFAAGNEARVIVVGIRDVRIADRKGAVRDWVIAESEEGWGSNVMMNGAR
jgi:hypothetical protein